MYYLADFQQDGRDRIQRNRNLEWRHFTRTDAEGEFSFDRVVAGVAYVMRKINTGDDSYEKHLSSHGIEVGVVAGKQANVKLGGTERAVVGKCILQDIEKPSSRIYGEVILMKNDVVGSTLKKAFFYWGAGLSISGVPRTQRQTVFLGEPTQLGTYAAGLAADGSFRIEDVPPGKYKMETVFFGPPQERKPGKKIGVIMGNHMIPAAKKGEEGPFDLGERSIDVSKPVAAPQEIPVGKIE